MALWDQQPHLQILGEVPQRIFDSERSSLGSNNVKAIVF